MIEQQTPEYPLVYPDPVVNYPKIVKKDLMLAEAYRLADPKIPFEEKKLNPFQVKVGRKKSIWVDVVLERKKGVRIHDLEQVMHVYGKPGRSRYITGRVRAEKLPLLNELAERIQTSRIIRSTLNLSLKAIQANRSTINNNSSLKGMDGSGVIVGIVDYGCDFDHPNFKSNEKTRLLYLWDQNGEGGERPKNYEYGNEFGRAQINTALSKQDPYNHLKNYYIEEDAHGTHVMDIAAGSSPAADYLGVAPGADLIFVDLRRPILQKNMTAVEFAEKELETLGSSRDLLDAVRYIFEKADEKKKPAVVNLSLAANGGGHNGTSLIESMFDDLLSNPSPKYGRAIVIAAGNDYQKKLHTSGTITAVSPARIKVNIPDAGSGIGNTFDLRQEIEIWYPKGQALKVEVIDPRGNLRNDLTCRLGEHRTTNDGAVPTWTIYNAEANTGIDTKNNRVGILVDNHSASFEKGEWEFRLSYDELQPVTNNNIPFHAWIENISSIITKNNRNEVIIIPSSYFSKDSKKDTTINGIANARHPIVVGACLYDVNQNKFETSYYTSAGPSLNPKAPHKPDIHAPGDAISSAKALSEGRFDHTGTSMAAPHVTGIIALMFQRALSLPQPRVLTIDEIRSILIDAADDGGQAHDSRLGFGRVNGLKALEKII